MIRVRFNVAARVLIAASLMGLIGVGRGLAQPDIAVTVTLGRIEGDVLVAPADGTAAPDSTVVYLFRLQNLAPAAQTFSLKLTTSPRWRASLPQHPKSKTEVLAPTQVEIVPVAVVVPKRIEVGETGLATLTAMEEIKPKLKSEATVMTTVVAPAGLSLTLDATQLARAGDMVAYRGTIANEGEQPEQVTVSGESMHGWPVAIGGTAEASVIVPAGQSVEVIFEVAVPPEVATGTTDALIVTVETLGLPAGRLQAVGVTNVQ